MIESYEEYATDFIDTYRFFLNLLTDSKNSTFSFSLYCRKRPNWLCFGLSFFLNISYKSMIEDYLLTNKLWKTTLKLPIQVSKSSIKAMLRAEVDYINSAINKVKDEYKNIDSLYN